MAKKRAFVKYTKSGDIIPGSLIVTTKGGYPVDGLYKEVSANYCCPINPNTSREFPLTFDLSGTTQLPTSTNLFISLQCVGDGSRQFISFFTGPSLNSYEEFVNYFNTNFSFFGYFELSGSIVTLYLNPEIRNLYCDNLNDAVFLMGDM